MSPHNATNITLGRAIADTELAHFAGAAECTVTITVSKRGEITITTEGSCPEIEVN